jgi:hypothetical protein
MRKLFWPFLLVYLCSCDNHAFEADKRQILAKNELRKKFHDARSFSVRGFRQDTLQSWRDSSFKRPLRYTLDFVYQDSTGALSKKQNVVIFSPEGEAILDSYIIDNP